MRNKNKSKANANTRNTTGRYLKHYAVYLDIRHITEDITYWFIA